MARPDSWMPVYWGDLWNKTRNLTAVEQCAYYNLLGSMWMEGGSLPNDNDRLQRMSRVTEKEWRAVCVTVTAYFELRDGRYYQSRLTEEYAKAMKAYTARSEHMANVNSKRKQSPRTVTVTRTADTTHNSQSPSGDTPVAPKGADDEFGLFFDEQIWSEYPKRAGDNPKKTARAKFIRLCKAGEDPQVILAGVKAYAANPATKIGTEFVKTAEVWLNKECWKDAAPPAPVPAAKRAPTDEEWCGVIEAFLRTGNWPLTGYGMQYGYSGCIVPKHLIAKYNLDGLNPPSFMKKSA